MMLACIVVAIFAVVQFTIENLDDGFYPRNELDYVNYLKLILDRQDLATVISEEQAKLAATIKEKYAIDLVVIAFVPYASKTDPNLKQTNESEIQLKGKLLQELVFETPQLFIVTSLPASEQARLRQLIQAYKKDRKLVHVIRGPTDQVRRLSSMLSMEEQQNRDKINYAERRSKKSPSISRPSQ